VPESKPAEPAPAGSAEPVCVEGMTGTFTGTFNKRRSQGDSRRVHDDDFGLQHDLGDGQRLCARIHGPVRFDERDGAIRELPPGASVEIETSEGRTRSQRMLITEESGGPRYQWWRNGAAQALDDPARAWLADALAVVAAFRAIGSLQGQVGSLQGAIGSIQGEVGSLQGQIGSIQGEEGSLQGKIGSIQGELGSLQGAIGGHQGAIGGLQGARWRASAAQLEQIEREIQQHEAAIRKLEAEMTTRGFSRRISEAESELRTFQQGQERRIADLRRQIEAVHAESRIDQLKRQIDDLHADDRIEVIKREMRPALERLKAHVHQLED
jgi:flagellar biosynthesis chaperone FliJ